MTSDAVQVRNDAPRHGVKAQAQDVPPGYKRTELGTLPVDWTVKSLGAVLVRGRLGGNYPNSELETDFPLMKMGNVGRGSFDLTKVEFVTPGRRPQDEHRLRRGDVLFNTRNTLDLVGKVALWREELPIAFYNSNLMRFEFDPEQVVSTAYANYALNASASIERLRGLATGTTSVAAIYTRDLVKLPMIVPSLAEQRAIAEALSDVDGLLGALEALIAKKRAIKQAAMQQLLTGKTRLPGFSGKWEKHRLADLADFWAGTYLPQGMYKDGAYDVQGAGGLMGRHDVGNIPRSLSVIGRVGTVGKPRFYPAGCWVNNNAGAIVARATSEPEFVHLLLVSMNWNSVVSVTAQPFLVVPDLINVRFVVPHRDEQRAIATVLTDMDAAIAALEARRDKTRAIKQGIMQQLLTGRVRLVRPEAAA